LRILHAISTIPVIRTAKWKKPTAPSELWRHEISKRARNSATIHR
jgi:hypothetical protein